MLGWTQTSCYLATLSLHNNKFKAQQERKIQFLEYLSYLLTI